MIMNVTCQQCGAEFTGWHTRLFCDECRRLRNVEYMKRRYIMHPPDKAKERERHKRYYVFHREQELARNRLWREAHPDYYKQKYLTRKNRSD